MLWRREHADHGAHRVTDENGVASVRARARFRSDRQRIPSAWHTSRDHRLTKQSRPPRHGRTGPFGTSRSNDGATKRHIF